MPLIEGQIAPMLVVEDIPCTAIGPLGRSTVGVSFIPPPPPLQVRILVAPSTILRLKSPPNFDSFAWRLSIGHFFSWV